MPSGRLLLATLFVMLSVVNATAQQPPVRHGLFGGFIAGGGQNVPDRCVSLSLRHDCWATDMVDVHAGWTFRPDLAAMGRLAILNASGYPGDSLLGAAVRYWPARRFWLSVGFGVGALAAGDDPGGVLSGAAGLEVLRFTHVTVGAQGEWFTARPGSNRWTNNISLAFALDWYATQ